MIDTDDLLLAGYFAVDSGQAMVGDPVYLDGWDTNKNDEWNIEGKEGQYSFHGASATTRANSYGELGNGTAVAFNTGYGDGLYPVYVQMNDDGRVSKVIIDFEGDIDEAEMDPEDEDEDEDEDSNSGLKLLIKKDNKAQKNLNFVMVTDLYVVSQILGELYKNYKEDEYFKDFIEFNDLGLPLAYFVGENLCGVSAEGERYITETWELFLSELALEDLGWESLDQILQVKLANG